MSKRKIVVGGYEDSSDPPEPEVSNQAHLVKKSRPAVASLPRLSTSPHPGKAPFQFPTTGHPSGHGSGVLNRAGSLRPTSASITPSAPGTPASGQLFVDRNLSEPKYEGPDAKSTGKSTPDLKSKELPTLPLHTDQVQATATKSTQPRLTITMERQFNELSAKLEKYYESSSVQHEQTKEQLKKLFDTVSLLTPPTLSPAHGLGSNPTTLFIQPSPTLPAAPAISDPNHTLSNPMPTAELIEIMEKVTTLKAMEFPTNAIDNSVKAHMHMNFYRVLKIKSAKDIGPPYEDEYGNPDTLPARFTDPVTKYCQPCPHWTTIPNGDSEISTILRGLTDENLASLLYHGPWKSARQAWVNMNKSPEILSAMRARKLEYHKAERKAFTRLGYLREIPGLQSTNWEFLAHSGYMSEEEEVDGVIVVKWPSHRANWVNNLFDAIEVAETKKLEARARFSCSTTAKLPQKVSTIDLPVPLIRRNAGSGKAVIQIPLCVVSKSWREQHSREYAKISHLIEPRVAIKPNISDFLLQHPKAGNKSLFEALEKAGESASPLPATQDGERSLIEGEYNGVHGAHAQGDNVPPLGLCLVQDNEELSMGASQYDPPLVSNDAIGGLCWWDGGNTRNMLIDPQLLDVDCQVSPNNHKLQDPVSNPEGSKAPPDPAQTAYPAASTSMPPPPLLEPKASESHINVVPTGGIGNNTGDLPNVEQVAPAPKKRGRPKGSKNRPKTVPANI
ncbi:hypothetical protein CTheo_7543 [Ceratobasidium theobromae]|uniref:Uncharacterized protein n=1 Tax=Ceratobasidium theobromae TaxID=1582974 RepID=A0A5N5QC55_9AGAM|nr:hypothetical protein CTheo_7543 [Ceratobasidium theobromae]